MISKRLHIAVRCNLLFRASFNDVSNVFISAFLFGLAHIHHRFDANVSWLAVLVQLAYTTLFGAYSSYLFLRTGLVYGPLVAHSFCNFMGLPDFGGISLHPHSKLVGFSFLFGLSMFIALVTYDAVQRPSLFNSCFWVERSHSA